MKKTLSLLFFLFFGTCTYANTVDSLTNNEQVKNFLTPLINTLSSWHKVKTLDIKKWQVIDFNNDGRSDLISLASFNDNISNFIAIDKGDNTFKIIRLINDGGDLIKIVKIENIPTIMTQSKVYSAKKETNRRNLLTKIQTDTLIYKYGDFVEYNKESANYKIDSIVYKVGPCFGDCPVFKIEIDRHGRAKYDRTNPNVIFILKPGEKIQYVFNMVLKKSELKQIYGLLEYINIKKLNETYAVPWTDDSKANITIKFMDGSVKTISDYGLTGTFGLLALYKNFYALTKNTDWK